MSVLDAAAKALAESGELMTTRETIEAMATRATEPDRREQRQTELVFSFAQGDRHERQGRAVRKDGVGQVRSEEVAGAAVSYSNAYEGQPSERFHEGGMRPCVEKALNRRFATVRRLGICW